MKTITLTIAALAVFSGVTFGQNPALMTFFERLEGYDSGITTAMAAGDNAALEAIYMDIAVMYEQQPSEVRSAASPMIVGVWYNIACYRALQGNSDGAIDALAKSVVLGWSDYSHMMNDPDLASIRTTPQFQKIAEKARNNR